MPPTCSVIASAAKQSRVAPRRQSGLLRSARNDDAETFYVTTPGPAGRRDKALQIPRQFGFELAVDRVLDLAAVDPDVAQGAVVEFVQRLDGGAALQAVEHGLGGAGERAEKSARRGWA